MTRTDQILRAIERGVITKAALSRAVGIARQHFDRWLAAAAPRDAAIDRALAAIAKAEKQDGRRVEK